MRLLGSTILLAFLMAGAGAQGDEPGDSQLHDLLTVERADLCADYYYNAVPLLERWYDEGKRDSIHTVIKFIRDHCAEDAFGGLAFLLGIEEDPESVSLCDLDLIQQILDDLENGWLRSYADDYFDRVREQSQWDTYDYWRINARPALHTRIAEKIIEETPEFSAANVCARYYLGQYRYVIDHLRAGDLEGSCLQAWYNTRVGQLRRLTLKNRLHGSYFAGVWVPHGAMNVLGPKMEIGAQLGWHDRLVGIDFVLGLRFIKAKEEYTVVKDGEAFTDDYFLGGMIGADIGMEGLMFGGQQFYPFIGFAYDGFDAAKDDDESRAVGSLNVSLGGVQRLFLNRQHTRYIGLQFRYNIVDYDTNGGTDLSGNAISINLLYGRIGNRWTRNAGNLGMYN